VPDNPLRTLRYFASLREPFLTIKILAISMSISRKGRKVFFKEITTSVRDEERLE
jgi:hypothetical protein